jgi:leucyl-tRNA synthetase
VCLGILAETFDAAAGTFPPVAEILDAVKGSSLAAQADFKNVMKMVGPLTLDP